MATYSFLDDYSEGCHPQILAALSQANLVQSAAYGNDEFSAEARSLIRAQCNAPDAGVYFVAGGTLANLIVSAASLRPHEAIISAHSGHIANREAGAIEATGHKIIAMNSADGKLTPDDVRAALAGHGHAPHMVKPKLVYISNATETGTVYNKAELTALREVSLENGLYLFIDGARLGAALCSPVSDLTLADLAQLSDIFYIGGTKNGTLLGEAIVISNPALNVDFGFHIKQRGAMLAKGRVLGIQFAELFRDGLFFEIAQHANAMAQKLSAAIVAQGHELSAPTASNQIFAILPNTLIETLNESFAFYPWQPIGDDRTLVRLVTSWATEEKQVDAFIAALGQ